MNQETRYIYSVNGCRRGIVTAATAQEAFLKVITALTLFEWEDPSIVRQIAVAPFGPDEESVLPMLVDDIFDAIYRKDSDRLN